MQQILDAIMSGTATADDFAALDVPQRYRAAWTHAAARTPHGNPIELSPKDFHD